MATVTITQVVDDIDGTGDASTIRFSIGRSGYEIDLSEENTEKLYAALSPFIAKARKAPAAATAAGGKRATAHRGNQTAIREWARENGYEVSDRGRISNELNELYQAAHS
jgi:nucleoid-associated protein Lsr2